MRKVIANAIQTNKYDIMLRGIDTGNKLTYARRQLLCDDGSEASEKSQ